MARVSQSKMSLFSNTTCACKCKRLLISAINSVVTDETTKRLAGQCYSQMFRLCKPLQVDYLHVLSHYWLRQQIVLVFVPLIKWLPQQWNVDDVNYAGHEH